MDLIVLVVVLAVHGPYCLGGCFSCTWTLLSWWLFWLYMDLIVLVVVLAVHIPHSHIGQFYVQRTHTWLTLLQPHWRLRYEFA